MKGFKLLATTAMVAVLSTPAMATDIFGRDAVSAKDAVVEKSWTGFWLGAGGGYGMMNNEIGASFEGEGSASLDGLGADGFIGVLQAGYDRQIGDRLVAGFWIEGQLANVKTELNFGEDSAELSRDDSYGIAGRIGVLFTPKTMLYVGGGWTMANFSDVKFDGVTLLKEQEYQGYFGEAGIETQLYGNVYGKLAGRWTQYDDETLFKFKDGDETFGQVTSSPDELSVLGTISVKLN